ncbi:preprotein translocase subunit SecY [Candidatus Uhrbacteria bacterium]|nr:preprotein translocase subunit SecY [Candidatus Uhrbacteria bacterium]
MNRILSTIIRIWRLKDLRRSILYVVAMLFIFRLAAHIPIPGVNTENLQAFFRSNAILGLLNVFSGGTMESFSVVALGVAPYITSSIIFQLLAMVVPQLEALQKEGEAGRQKINQWTRYAAVPLAALQGFGLITLLRQSPIQIIGILTPQAYIITILTLTAGTMFLMWIGELITERKVGNGISLLIFAGIIAGLPTAAQQVLVSFDPTQALNFALFAALSLTTVVGVVLITQAQRNIPVSYARRVRGMKMYGGVDTHLPLKVNMAGVIPIIFAISIVLFPPMIAQFFLQASNLTVVRLAQWVVNFFQNNLVYGILYFILVFIFTYFYTAVVFHPGQIAENLQKQGGFVPGIRPGKPTAAYLQYVTSRVILVGALFLAVIAVLPLAMQRLTGLQALAIGGTSVLIVVSVVIETLTQIEAQLTMHEYET